MRASRSRVRAAACACALTLPGLCAAGAAPLIPLEQFAQGPEMTAPDLSPDGSKLVFVSTIAGERYVLVRDLLKSGAPPRPILRGSSDSYDVVACYFKTNTRLLCSFRGIEHDYGLPYPASRLVVMDSEGGHPRVLFQSQAYTYSQIAGTQFQDRILHWLPNDPEHVLIQLADTDSIFPGVFTLNVDSGVTRPVVGAHPPVLDWIVDRDGVVRFGYGFRDDSALYLARNGAKDQWRTLEKFKRFEDASFSPLGFGPLPNQLFVLAPQDGRDAIWQMDLAENSDYQLLFARPDADVDGIVTWPDQRVVGFRYNNDLPHTEFIDPEAAAIDRAMDKALPGTVHDVIDTAHDGHLLLIRSYSDVEPGVYHLLDLNEHKLTPVGHRNSALSQASLAPTKPVVVPGPGGISMHGYLTVPVGTVAGKAIAAVVFPHGGPYARDYWGYDDLVQLMANRGYAVLQLNFRGSTGYGREWRRAGHQAWGTIMHEDITAGAHWLVSQGIADPARMCIVGWSYGGYAALTAAVKEQHLYRCAVSIAGVSDLSQLARDDSWSYGGRDAVRDATGTDKAQLAAQSPVLHADQIKIPILLVHGDDDSTVRLSQSEAMAKALKQHGVPNELVVIKGGEHSLLRPQMRLALYRKLEAFLAANLGSP
jgi:dipeptidyl aminopeptidase/acylaminoacyl peptidase